MSTDSERLKDVATLQILMEIRAIIHGIDYGDCDDGGFNVGWLSAILAIAEHGIDVLGESS